MNEQPKKKLSVIINQINSQQVAAEAHGQKITLSTVGDNPSAGLTAPEVVLAALGTCIVSNIKKGAREMELQIDDVAITVTAEKRTNPLGLNNVQYVVTLYSSEPKEKLQILYEKATTNGTATNALLEGLKPGGELKIKS
jgi:uncharacterized OsmC-like protein